MAGWKCINDFSALSSSNVRTEPETNVGDGSFELKSALINMVQQNQFCGKASEDANAHLQYFLEICSTFTIRGVTQDALRLHLFSFSLLRKVKQWFYSNKEVVPSFFHWARPMPFGTRSLPFNNSRMKPLPRHGSACRIISLHAPITAWRSSSSSKASIMGRFTQPVSLLMLLLDVHSLLSVLRKLTN
jgi:hypothetical protein